MAASDTVQKKRNNYKLLADPELKKGSKKLYRLNGVSYKLNGKDVEGFPPCDPPKDPRTQKTVLGQAMEFKLPRFKYDKFWQGAPPERDVFVIGLNENVRGSLFREVCIGLGNIQNIKNHLHPKSKTFLGASTVSFHVRGVGQTAVKELDGKVVGGCYLRAELDDDGEHLRKYMEPVLKKCGLDKRTTSATASKQYHATCGREGLSGDGGGSISDSDGIQTRSSSIAESTCDLSESEVEGATPSVATPITPTTFKAEPFTKPSEGGSSGSLLYPFSSLHLIADSPAATEACGGFSSPMSFSSQTPGSIDSGISIRTHSTAIVSPSDPRSAKWSSLNPSSSSSSSSSFPPLPPEENAPPLPPSPQDDETPPPLPPPLTPQHVDDVCVTIDEGGIENISSDEECLNKEGPTTPPITISSPLPTATTAAPSIFNPSLGLQTLLANQRPMGDGGTKSSVVPYVALRPTYELEVEEISGDESPVMVYFEPLKVESISDDDGGVVEGGGADMDISDNENDQDNVIELNVETAPRILSVNMGVNPMLGPHLPFHMPHLSFIPGPPSNFFPPPAPHLPPPPPHLPPGYSIQPPYNFTPHIPIFPPMGAHKQHSLGGQQQQPSSSHARKRDGARRRFDSPPRHFIKDHQVLRHPNGYIGSVSRFPPSRSFSRSKVLRKFSSPASPTEKISQDVLFKAFEQLRLILHNDVNKKIVESSAYPVLEEHWEKREKEKLVQKSEIPERGEVREVKAAEPYRHMMPGMKEETSAEVRIDGGVDRMEGESEEDEEIPTLPTPRKRLLNFKIPLLGGQRRDQQKQMSVVARRRLFTDDSENREDEDSPVKAHSVRQGRGYYSDISSSEDFSSEEDDEEGEGRGSSGAESEGGFSSDADRSSGVDHSDFNDVFGSDPSSDDEDFEKFLENSKKKKKTRKKIRFSSEPSDDNVLTSKVWGKTKRIGRPKKMLTIDNDDLLVKKGVAQEKGYLKKAVNIELLEEEVEPQPCKPCYKRRVSIVESAVLDSFLEVGLDSEDVQMFKLAMARLKEEGDTLVDDIPWSHYPHIPPSAPPPTKKRRVSKYASKPEEEVHTTGSARSEGYYKIDMREKVKYLPHHNDRITSAPAKQKTQLKSSGRKNRANQRKLASLYSAGDVSRDLAKYNQFKARKKQLKFAKSAIHNWGLFALEAVPADEMVIEYVGEVVRQCVADEREKRYEAAGIGSSYLFRVDQDYIIDATRRGGLARFINHCCDPNCYAKVINFQTGKKIVIYSKRDIALGEEITYDYKFPIEEEKIPCLCGAPNCRSTLN